MDIVILTDRRYIGPPTNTYESNIHQEEGLLMAALAELGLSSVRVDWADPHFSWPSCRVAILRSTWDYFERIDEFTRWLKQAETQTKIINPSLLQWWNLDKHYLADLQAKGIPVPPTLYFARGVAPSLAKTMLSQGWGEVVLKPAVSGAARETYRISASAAEAQEENFTRLVAQEAMLLQPFIPSVLTAGEVSLIVVGGRCTHAVRKVAKPGDFRVQDDHGGTVHLHLPAPDERAFAERAVAACPILPLYARVDLVRGEQAELLLMELELIEPELFLRFHPPAATALAHAIHRTL